VGAGTVGQLVARKLIQHPEYGLRLVGFVDSNPRERRPEVRGLPILGCAADLASLVEAHGVERVFVAFAGDSNEELLAAVRSLAELNVQVDIVPRLFEVVNPNVDLRVVEGMPLIGLPPAKLSRSSRFLKRTLDVAGASLGLILTGPLFAYAVWWIKRESPGPVLFRQERVGFEMRRFTMLKFRTMRVDADQSRHEEYIRSTMDAGAAPGANGLYKLERASEVTRFGRWLRKTSLDEVPQLINVLRGDMSLVGPRPCIPYELEYFEPHHFERFLIRPGLTGLWQVQARARSTFGEALEMDVAYVRGWSLGLDLALLCRTPAQLIRPATTA
jgi:exopolysaccharide biosynthesis polyprenyl glycosylphosphotransferase